MAVVAVLVFVVAYILIATERVPKMVTALVGAGIILGLGVASADEVSYSHETGDDWDVIFRVGRSIWRRSKPHTRWEGCASRARWPRQSCSLPPIKRPSSPAQYFRLVLGSAMSWSGQLPVACRLDAGRADSNTSCRRVAGSLWVCRSAGCPFAA